MPLNDAKVRTAKPKEKTYRLSDAGGLYLEVTPQGGRYWRWKYRHGGKEKRLALGVYPAVSLSEARTKRDNAKALHAMGTDPSHSRKQAKLAAAVSAATSFEAVAREWWNGKHRTEVVETHSGRNLRRLELYLFPAIGFRPIDEITPAELLTALQAVEQKGTIETARRVRTLAGQVFRYAIPSGRASRDIAADLKDALQTPQTRHHAAITEPERIGELLRAIHGYQARGAGVSHALKLAPLLFVRPGELRHAEWADFRLDVGEWAYKPSKGALPMTVPLPSQAVAILRELHALTGQGRYLFPSARGKGRPMSGVTINAALSSLGYDGEMTGHGFRAMARTLLAERLGFSLEVIEMQLAHAVKDANGRAYNRTTYLEQRRRMLQAWADYLDALRAGETPTIGSDGNVIPISRTKGVTTT